ncbi:MAG: glycosyltransferase family 2 protein [Microthrixaceae bacterium]
MVAPQRSPAVVSSFRSISAVVPVYRSGATLPRLVDSLENELVRLAEEYEIILVDDGSPDDTWEWASSLAGSKEAVRAIRLTRNFGEHNAVLCGLRVARSEIVVTLDDDLQHPPAEIPRLVEACRSGADLVYGISDSYRHGRVRTALASPAKSVVQRLFGVDDLVRTTTFRAFRSGLRDAVPLDPGPRFVLDPYLRGAATTVVHIVVAHSARESGRSNYGVARLARHTLSTVVGARSPMITWFVVGALLSLASPLLLLATVVATIAGHPVLLGGVVVSVAAMVAGLLLLGLAVVAEYAAQVLARLDGVAPIGSTRCPNAATGEDALARELLTRAESS